MLAKQKTIVVSVNGEDKEFVHNTWGASKAFTHLPKIGKAFAVPFSMLFSDKGEISDKLPEALMLLFQQMEEEDVWGLFQLITSGVYYKTAPINLDEDLEGDLGAVLMLVAEAAKQNYGSLWGKGLLSLRDTMLPMAQIAKN